MLNYVVPITQKNLREVTVDAMLLRNCPVWSTCQDMYINLAIKVKEHWEISLKFIIKAQEWHHKGLYDVFYF